MLQVFELGGEVVPQQLAHNLMRLIAEGAGEEDEGADAELRSQAVQSYLELLNRPRLPSILLKVHHVAYDTMYCMSSNCSALRTYQRSTESQSKIHRWRLAGKAPIEVRSCSKFSSGMSSVLGISLSFSLLRRSEVILSPGCHSGR